VEEAFIIYTQFDGEVTLIPLNGHPNSKAQAFPQALVHPALQHLWGMASLKRAGTACPSDTFLVEASR